MRKAAGIASILALAVLGYVLVIPNFQECREAGHSVRYCVLTHLVR